MDRKLRILYLKNFFENQTDFQNIAGISDIIKYLETIGINADRKTIYNDIELLRMYGLDIVFVSNKGYFIASREFELPEVKLLADTVAASKFITKKKSEELIQKISSLASRHEASLVRRQVYVSGRVKTSNERIYYTVDAIHEAISNRVKITFRYHSWSTQKKRVYKKDGALYEASPLALTFSDENYYLIAYSRAHNGIVHFRVDKMSDTTVTDIKRDEFDYEKFDIAQYQKKIFSMYGGEETRVEIIFENRLIGVVVDRFGEDVKTFTLDENHFKALIDVEISPIFIGWIMQFKSAAKITAPQNLIDEIKGLCMEILDVYE